MVDPARGAFDRPRLLCLVCFAMGRMGGGIASHPLLCHVGCGDGVKCYGFGMRRMMMRVNDVTRYVYEEEIS